MTRYQPIPKEWFACPCCKKELSYTSNGASCVCSSYAFNAAGHYWDFYPAGVPALQESPWKTWEVLQDNAEIAHNAAPEQNLGVGKREDFLRFGNFCKFRGAVLDVGCGPQRLPTHVEYCMDASVFYVGLDPLIGDQPRDYPFVRGLGEFLPFREALFDQVLFVTSMDHFVDPLVPLREAKRVLKKDGEICVWFGEKAKDAPPPKESPEWYKTLVKPEASDDPFHYKRFTQQTFEDVVARAGLMVNELHLLRLNHWRRSLSYKLVPDA